MRRPSEIDPTNLRVETVRGAMMVGQTAQSGGHSLGFFLCCLLLFTGNVDGMMELTVIEEDLTSNGMENPVSWLDALLPELLMA